jgi:benzoyl-CoA reductase/2-hydroxyglutaryl-CoA dehydratase subunit BcrC/BadD/HgdB
LEDDVHFEYVITLEQDPSPAVRAQARTQARADAAEARARAQQEAQEARDEFREEIDRMREEIREQVRAEMQHPDGPTIMIPPRRPWEQGPIPPQIVDIITMFVIATVICIVALPLARAFARWVDRRGLPSPVNAELAAQINRIEQAVDSMAVEVERISEAQRFQAKLLADKVQA